MMSHLYLMPNAGGDPTQRPNSKPKPNQNKNHDHSAFMRLTVDWTFHVWTEEVDFSSTHLGRAYCEGHVKRSCVVTSQKKKNWVACVWHAVNVHLRTVMPRQDFQKPATDELMEVHQGADRARYEVCYLETDPLTFFHSCNSRPLRKKSSKSLLATSVAHSNRFHCRDSPCGFRQQVQCWRRSSFGRSRTTNRTASVLLLSALHPISTKYHEPDENTGTLRLASHFHKHYRHDLRYVFDAENCSEHRQNILKHEAGQWFLLENDPRMFVNDAELWWLTKKSFQQWMKTIERSLFHSQGIIMNACTRTHFVFLWA